MRRGDLLAAAPVVGLKVQILKASNDREIDAAFVSLVQARTGALLVATDLFFNNRIERLIELAAHYAIPTMYAFPEFVVAGGLISYGMTLVEQYRQVGLYTGRILKGERPADLPIIQATKLALIINLKTAKALGLQIPDRLLALADEVVDARDCAARTTHPGSSGGGEHQTVFGDHGRHGRQRTPHVEGPDRRRDGRRKARRAWSRAPRLHAG